MTVKKEIALWCVLLVICSALSPTIAQDRPAAGMTESDLIAVLQSDAAKGEKAITCKRLAIYGTERSVPALAPLLADEELASWARIALEAIPGPAADAALRGALGKLQGRLLIGAINSIGVRRDARSVDALVPKLGDADANVAAAAAVALGHIGSERAVQALMKSLVSTPAGVRSAVAEGCILCAEQLLDDDASAQAVKLYDAVRNADVPDQRHLEAIRGAILARRSAGVPLLIEQLRSEDAKRLGIGLRTARELAGRDVTEALANELPKLNADRRPLLLMALADRRDPTVVPTIIEAAQSSQNELRITAIRILIRLGNVSCVPVLLEAATDGDAQVEQAAMETLVRLPGNDVDADLIARLPQSRGRLRRVLVELAGQRQIGQALPVVVSSLQDVDPEIRAAAVGTIAIIGQDRQVVDLVKMLQATRDSEERTGLRKALLAICGRAGASCVPDLRPLTQSADDELRMISLHALAIVGGPEALATVRSAVDGAESPVQDEAVRILSTWPNNWPEDSEAGQALLTLATSAEKTAHHVLGLRGYLQYVRGSKKLANEQKATQVKDVLAHVKRPEEKRQAIAVLAEVPHVAALDLLTQFAEDPTVVEESYSAMVQIASQDIPGVSKDRRRQVLQMVMEKSKNNGTRQRARRTLGGIR